MVFYSQYGTLFEDFIFPIRQVADKITLILCTTLVSMQATEVSVQSPEVSGQATEVSV